MQTVIIGAGGVASHLAPALQQQGLDIVEVWSRSRAAAVELADRLNSHAANAGLRPVRALWGSLNAVTTDADLYVIAVKDSALAEVIRQLHIGREGALMVHTAGSMSLSLFAEVGHERGGVCYPMQTFSKGRAVDFSHVHFFVEAARETDEQLLTTLAQQVTHDAALVHRSTSALRRRLHLAAVFACNFVNHCCTLSDSLLADVGLDFSVMLPLLDETVAKLHELPPAQAQTGPAVRRDENVMGLQRAMLIDCPDLERLYSLLSESIMKGSKGG